MKGFFSDREVRKFSFKEKITYIFNQLYTILQPVETTSHETVHFSYRKPKRIKTIFCNCFNEKGIPLINEIELPFTGISVKTDSLEYIEIIGENFCYKFPPTMMPQIWYRLKRML